MFKFKHHKWSDQDVYFGPFTYSRDRHYKPLSFIFDSGDDDDYPGCTLRIRGFGHTLITPLPAIIKPWKQKIIAKYWDAETIKRMGGNFYYDKHEREYGFSYLDGHLSIYYGRQTHDSSSEQQWGTFLAWTQWRFIRESLYDIDGNLYSTAKQKPCTHKVIPDYMSYYDQIHEMKKSCPAMTFSFLDYDGQRLTARTQIEEREWQFGEGWFTWLSWFTYPKIVQSLDIMFSGETGPRKKSYKGGTIGHSITMLPGESHESAFRRYCQKHNMTFEGVVDSEYIENQLHSYMNSISEEDKLTQYKKSGGPENET
jgi:hypothetical protein